MDNLHRATLALLLAAVGICASAAPGVGATAGVGATPIGDSLFHDVDRFWTQQIASLGGRYRAPSLSYLSQPKAGLCSLKFAVAGSFYCPGDETVYLDSPFLRQLQQRARDQADLALGYLVAHEVAHHIQNMIGTTALVEQARARSNAEVAKRSLTAMELQADCYAGLWAHWARQQGALAGTPDVDAALAAVAAVAQDTQSNLTGTQQMIDLLTHGTAQQRSRWFRLGLDSGSFNNCDTFGAAAAGQL
jgi:uncharacterized protein